MATAPRGGAVERLIGALQQVEGAYSLVALADDHGDRRARSARRPAAGARRLGEAHILTSETCALDIIGAESCATSSRGSWW